MAKAREQNNREQIVSGKQKESSEKKKSRVWWLWSTLRASIATVLSCSRYRPVFLNARRKRNNKMNRRAQHLFSCASLTKCAEKKNQELFLFMKATKLLFFFRVCFGQERKRRVVQQTTWVATSLENQKKKRRLFPLSTTAKTSIKPGKEHSKVENCVLRWGFRQACLAACFLSLSNNALLSMNAWKQSRQQLRREKKKVRLYCRACLQIWSFSLFLSHVIIHSY